MGGRGQLVLHHHQMRAAGKESIMPRRHWRGGACSHEVRPPEVCLTLSSLPAHAGSSARGPRFPARAGYESRRFKLEKIRRDETRCEMAAGLFRSSVAQRSGTAREDELHPDESSSQRLVPASGGLVVGISSKRPPTADLVGRDTPCAPRLL